MWVSMIRAKTRKETAYLALFNNQFFRWYRLVILSRFEKGFRLSLPTLKRR
ncbi:MAG: hypothetical protein ACJAX5_002703 [Patiriisocius sp.]|jgi:hypothetical protein